MFSGESGGSKVALAALAADLHGRGWPLIDAQVENPHLLSMGAERLPRADFLHDVQRQVALAEQPGSWSQRYGEHAASDLCETHLT